MYNLSHLSIVIPVGLNDHSWKNLLNELAIFGSDIEIIISACQQQDNNFTLSENVKWIQTTQGRAQQLNMDITRQAKRRLVLNL